MPDTAPDFAKIIAKAWRDPAFKAELIANPAAALKAEGIDVPDGIAVTVVENTDKQFHLVLPPVPTDVLSEGDLEAVAGGIEDWKNEAWNIPIAPDIGSGSKFF
jgi:hypothetical protein